MVKTMIFFWCNFSYSVCTPRPRILLSMPLSYGQLEVKHPMDVGVDQGFPHALRSSKKRSCGQSLNWEGMTSPIKHQLLLLPTKHSVFEVEMSKRFMILMSVMEISSLLLYGIKQY